MSVVPSLSSVYSQSIFSTPGISSGTFGTLGGVGVGVGTGILGSSNTPSLTDIAAQYLWVSQLEFPNPVFNGGAVHPVMNESLLLPLMFHTSTWVECCNPKTEDYGIISTQYAESSYSYCQGTLIIRDGKTYDEFQEWWKMYSSRFSDKEWQMSYYPYLKEGEQINGYPIKNQYHGYTLFGTSMPSNDEYNDWLWINKNTTGRIWRMNEYWIFADDAEMIQYKLSDKNENN